MNFITNALEFFKTNIVGNIRSCHGIARLIILSDIT